MKKAMTVTIDTETNPSRSTASDPVEHMIWGRFGGHQLGIAEMMDSADRHGARLTFFHDYPEYHQFGDSILEAARYIHERGHNVEIHLHPSRISNTFFRDRNLPVTKQIQAMDRPVAEAVMDHTLELHERATGQAATSFRGGAYQYSPMLLDVLKERGITVVSNDSGTHGVGVIAEETRPPFRWDNGLVEIPIANLPDWPKPGQMYAFNFNSAQFSKRCASPEEGVEKMIEYLSKYHALFPTSIPTMLLHSWSLWSRDENRMFSAPEKDGLRRFDLMLEAFSSEYDVVGFDTIAGDPERFGLNAELPTQPELIWQVA